MCVEGTQLLFDFDIWTICFLWNYKDMWNFKFLVFDFVSFFSDNRWHCFKFPTAFYGCRIEAHFCLMKSPFGIASCLIFRRLHLTFCAGKEQIEGKVQTPLFAYVFEYQFWKTELIKWVIIPIKFSFITCRWELIYTDK